MLQNRFPRFSKKPRNRNLDNLHVIQTGLSKASKPKPPQSESPNPSPSSHVSQPPIQKLSQQPPPKQQSTKQQSPNQQLPPQKLSKERPYRRKRLPRQRPYKSNQHIPLQIPYQDRNFFMSRKSKKQRRRDARRFAAMQAQHDSYSWYNPNYMNQEVYSHQEYNASSTVTNWDNSFSAPVEDNYFEEVEAVSFENEAQHEISIGYKKTKIHYLRYKTKSFFKPKIYGFLEQRAFVKCSNAQAAASPDVDIVSEAEYDVEYESGKSERAESIEQLNVIEEVTCIDDDSVEVIEYPKENSVFKSGARTYKLCIEENPDLHQGKSLIQNSLDTWKSHLIGLQYLIEIQSQNKDSVLKYHCVLCNEDLSVEGFPAILVINHINGYKHIAKYLEKHFPACGYRFDESSSDNSVLILQTFCEEINKEVGYYCMCITNIDKFMKNKEKMQNIILNALDIDKSVIFDEILPKKIDSVLADNVKDVLNDIIVEISPTESGPESSVTETSKKTPKKVEKKSIAAVSSKTDAIKSNTSQNVKQVTLNDKADAKTSPVSFSKSRSNSAMCSYLKLMYGKPKLKKSLKDDTTEKEVKKLASISKETPLKKDVPKEKVMKDVSKKTSIMSKTAKSASYVKKPNIKDKLIHKYKERALQKPTLHSNLSSYKKSRQNASAEKVDKSEEVKHDSDDDIVIISEFPAPSSVTPNIHNTLVNKYKERALKKPALYSKSSSYKKNFSCKDVSTENMIEVDKSEEVKGNSEEATVAASKTAKSTACAVKPSIKHTLIHKYKEKALQKSPLHSKYCKRILGTGNSRLRMVTETRSKDENGDVSNKTGMKYQSVSESVVPVSASKIMSSEKKDDLHKKEKITHSSRLKSPIRKVTLHKVIKMHSKPPSKDSKSPQRKVIRKVTDNSMQPIGVLIGVNYMKQKRTVTRHSQSPVRKNRSPVRPTITSPIRVPVRKSPLIPTVTSPIRVPVRRRSKSPVRPTITSPIRVPVRRRSKSPVRRQSPIRRHSRSPVRRHSRSPVRRHSRSPVRRRSRSPVRRRSRSPVRRRSRSPVRRRSRSPVRRQSRSPIRRQSRSPIRRQSRSPVRRQSRSPIRRHSISPVRRHSRSPVRRHSRSPVRRYSRSPIRRYSRSPVRKHSRSPIRKRSRSPVRKSRSPFRGHSRSPRRHSRSPISQYRGIYKNHSPTRGHSRSIQDHINSSERISSRSPVHSFDKHLSRHDLSEYSKSRTASRNLSPTRNSFTNQFLSSRAFASGSSRDIDLDPVSDEDESLYFSTSDNHPDAENIKTFDSKMMLAHFIQKISMPDASSTDPSMNKLIKFMESHSDEIQQLMGQSNSSRIDSKVGPNVQEQNSMLQQYLLSNLAGNFQAPMSSAVPFAPPVSNLPPTFNRPPFIPGPAPPAFRQIPPHMVTQNIAQSPHGQPRLFPPNLNLPPPERFSQLNQPRQILPPRPKVPPEIMFKDLKATVSKLFGANESAGKQAKGESNMPVFMTGSSPDKWDLNHPKATKFMPSDPKNTFHALGENDSDFRDVPGTSAMREEMPRLYDSNPGQFMNRANVDRSQPPNIPPIPPPDAKVAFCDMPRGSSKGNLFPVVNPKVNPNVNPPSVRGSVCDMKVSLAQRLASVLVKVGMIDVPAPLLQEMLMKIGAFSSSPPQDITEAEIVSILKRLGYLS